MSILVLFLLEPLLSYSCYYTIHCYQPVLHLLVQPLVLISQTRILYTLKYQPYLNIYIVLFVCHGFTYIAYFICEKRTYYGWLWTICSIYCTGCFRKNPFMQYLGISRDDQKSRTPHYKPKLPSPKLTRQV